jgi:hypothetical protein
MFYLNIEINQEKSDRSNPLIDVSRLSPSGCVVWKYLAWKYHVYTSVIPPPSLIKTHTEHANHNIIKFIKDLHSITMQMLDYMHRVYILTV